VAVDFVSPPVTAAEAHILGRLRALFHHCKQTGDAQHLEQLHLLAADAPAVSERVILQVECCLEELRSKHRPARQAASVWAALQERGERSPPPGDSLLMYIRSKRAQYTARCGTPVDLDEAVRLCLREWRQRRASLGEEHYWSQAASMDLAAALRVRSRNGDLAESLRILRRLVAALRKRHGGDHPFTWVAKFALAQTLVSLAAAAGTGDHGRSAGQTPGSEWTSYAAEAAELACGFADARHRYLGRDDAESLRALVLHAHAQLLLGEVDQSLREIRYAQAVARRTSARLDDGWADRPVAAACEAAAAGT